jgi:hypothetical protein
VFELFMSEGYSHVDVVFAEDDETDNVVAPVRLRTFAWSLRIHRVVQMKVAS